jgi:hypothetical protein
MPAPIPEPTRNESLAAQSLSDGSSDSPAAADSPPAVTSPRKPAGDAGSQAPAGPADAGQGGQWEIDLAKVYIAPPGGGGRGQAPYITAFGCSSSGGVWTFTGHVEDDTPGGLTIRFGGAPLSLQGKTAVTDSSGNFSLTLSLQTNGSDAGTATTDTTDPDGNNSNTAHCDVNP